MSQITSILATDLVSASRAVINTNFGNLNTDKVEGSVLSGNYVPAPANESLLGYAAMGSVIKAQTLGMNASDIFGNVAFSDGTARFIAVYLLTGQLLTGVKWYQATQGNYTADNNNYVALYSYSLGTLTRVAISADDGNVWKAASNTYGSAAFSGTYQATAGIYFIGMLYNSSAQVAAPAVGASTSLQNAAVSQLDFTDSAAWYGTLAAQSTLPVSQALSGLTTSGSRIWAAVY